MSDTETFDGGTADERLLILYLYPDAHAHHVTRDAVQAYVYLRSRGRDEWIGHRAIVYVQSVDTIDDTASM